VLFWRRHNDENIQRFEVVQRTRDIIEIVAIVLAGVWAIYTFVYQNRIQPASAPPEITVNAQLQRVGAQKGLLAIRVITHFKNVGSVTAHFLGYAVTVYGTTVIPRARPQPIERVYKGVYNRTTFYSLTRPVVAYSEAFLTNATDPTIGSDLFIHPGEEVQNDRTIYVPEHRFDRISLSMDDVFTKSTDFPIPTTLTYGRDGFPQFHAHPARGQDINQYETVVTSLDLSGR
jgi:hypothetical protein